MSQKTSIEWTDATWNPIRGCSRVSEGCRNCYAEKVAQRFSKPGLPYAGLIAKTGQWNGVIHVIKKLITEPMKWKKPKRIFVNSMSDLFHENVPFEMIDEIFAVMAQCPRHTFQILTKRPDIMRMLEPHELFAAQGFGKDYIIKHTKDGKPIPKYKQVARCGNSVCPPIAEAIVATNYQSVTKKISVKAG